MEFSDVLRRRLMIRSYQEDRQVPPDALDAILGAALRAPSAGFTQGVSLLVLSSDRERETFWQAGAESNSTWLRGMRTAPALVLVWTSEQAYLDRYAEPDKGWTDRGAVLVRRRRNGKYDGAVVGGRPRSGCLLLRHPGRPDCQRTCSLRRTAEPAQRRCDRRWVPGAGARNRLSHSPSAEVLLGKHSPRHVVVGLRFRALQRFAPL